LATSSPILVIGGTRGTGLLIVQLLSGQGTSVRVLARDPVGTRARVGPSVQVMHGDVTKPGTLPSILEGVSHIVFTAGVRSGRPASEAKIKLTEYDGMLNTLTAARDVGFAGRLLYMTASGGTTPSLNTIFLNLYKGNTLAWRRRAEDAIRASGLDYTIIRAGVLMNAPANEHALVVTQQALPLSLRHRVGRADVAQGFVASIHHPRASRATFEVVWGKGNRSETWSVLLDRLKPDAEIHSAALH
jgi:uncharacterized protein YbjT (DUF2867 family)